MFGGRSAAKKAGAHKCLYTIFWVIVLSCSPLICYMRQWRMHTGTVVPLYWLAPQSLFSILLTRLQSRHGECKRALDSDVSNVYSQWTQAGCPCRPVSCWQPQKAAGLVVHSTSGCGSRFSQHTPPPLSEPPPHACKWPDPGSLPRRDKKKSG